VGSTNVGLARGIGFEPILEGRAARPTCDLSESYDLLERKIVKPLERIPGVAVVRLDGVNPK
jgi:multidrug efflux pump subunit AcrB